MAVQHKNITGADNHEPKGVEAAAAGSVYIANGIGGGSWQSPTTVAMTAINQRALLMALIFGRK